MNNRSFLLLGILQIVVGATVGTIAVFTHFAPTAFVAGCLFFQGIVNVRANLPSV